MKYHSKFWNQYFKYYDILLKVIPYQELFAKLVRYLDLNPKMNVLDLGAGTGNLQHFISSDIDLVSLDNSEEALDRLRCKFPNAKTVKHSILEKLPFEDNTFDRILSNNVLYTLPMDKWNQVIAEMHRICKPNRIVVVSNLNKDFKAINIYKDHIQKSLRRKGILSTIVELCRLVYPTLKMLLYNKQINRNNKKGAYSFVKGNEQKAVFEKFNLKSLIETQKVYSNQAHLDVFVNMK